MPDEVTPKTGFTGDTAVVAWSHKIDTKLLSSSMRRRVDIRKRKVLFLAPATHTPDQDKNQFLWKCACSEPFCSEYHLCSVHSRHTVPWCLIPFPMIQNSQCFLYAKQLQPCAHFLLACHKTKACFLAAGLLLFQTTLSGLFSVTANAACCGAAHWGNVLEQFYLELTSLMVSWCLVESFEAGLMLPLEHGSFCSLPSLLQIVLLVQKQQKPYCEGRMGGEIIRKPEALPLLWISPLSCSISLS